MFTITYAVETVLLYPRGEKCGLSPYTSGPHLDIKAFCIDRHNGGVNCLSIDAAVRKVGLKELWMLNWRPGWWAQNPWSPAGGVQPGDWPRWMRKFKDY